MIDGVLDLTSLADSGFFSNFIKKDLSFKDAVSTRTRVSTYPPLSFTQRSVFSQSLLPCPDSTQRVLITEL